MNGWKKMPTRTILSLPPPPQGVSDDVREWCDRVAQEVQRLASELYRDYTKLRVQYNGVTIGTFDTISITDPNGCVVATDTGGGVCNWNFAGASCP